MKVIGIIAEYNPFHKGHAYQIACAREQFGADYVVAVMSGDFVQRGAPAIVDKYTRAEMALRGGADAVFELPSLWATASAEYFANGAVAALDRLGVVNGVCFGCETPDLQIMREVVGYLAKEPPEFQQKLRERLQAGDTYPTARLQAMRECVAAEKKPFVTEMLSTPNNILAIEYLKAIHKRNSKLEAFPIRRIGQSYHESGLPQEAQTYASASAIRRMIFAKETEQIKDALPKEVGFILLNKIEQGFFLKEDDFSQMLSYRLLSDTEYEKIADVTPDLANRVRRLLPEFRSVTEFCEKLKTKEITYTRASRVLFHMLLQHDKEMYELAQELGGISYLRLLGIRKESVSLLSEMKKSAAVPLLCRKKDMEAVRQSAAGSLLRLDRLASALYRGTLMQKTNTVVVEEERRPLLIV